MRRIVWVTQVPFHGKVLAKAGLLAGALIFLKKGWIIIALGVVGIGKMVGRFFKK